MLDIVDAQINMGPGGLEPTLAAMDALGIRAAIIDEFWGGHAGGDPGAVIPGYPLANGAWRTASPNAEMAALAHPDRFAYLVRVDRRDPDLESVLKLVKSTPHRCALRLLAARTAAEAAALAAGAYDQLFEIAQDLALPVFLFVPGHAHRLPPYLERFPRLAFIVDHCGVPFAGLGPAGEGRSAEASFEEVLQLAAYGNLSLKWSHAQMRLSPGEYPYAPLRPFLRRAVDAFGASRVMWASDYTVMTGHTWSQLLQFVVEHPELTDEEKAWVLGRSVRKTLGWEAGAAA